MSNWHLRHRKVIVDFLTYMNEKTADFVLKGGTALYLCHNLDRFSEDIDLDGRTKGMLDIITGFCEKNGHSFRVAKQTDTVERCFMNYGNEGKPLKIEASYRRREIPENETERIDGVLVYRIEPLCVMKANAYAGRDKIRDLYDVIFICKRYFDQLSPQTKAFLRGALEYKGIGQFDYIIKDQQDDLIDSKKLMADFLEVYEQLGLLYSEEESRMLSDTISSLNNGEDDE